MLICEIKSRITILSSPPFCPFIPTYVYRNHVVPAKHLSPNPDVSRPAPSLVWLSSKNRRETRRSPLVSETRRVPQVCVSGSYRAHFRSPSDLPPLQPSRCYGEHHDEGSYEGEGRRASRRFASVTCTTLWTSRIVVKRVTVTLHVGHEAVGAVGMLAHIRSAAAARMMRPRRR